MSDDSTPKTPTEGPGSPEGSSPEDPPPRLPRPSFFKGFALADLIRIAMFGSLLIAVIAMRKPCADSTARFISSFDDPDAGATAAETTETRADERDSRGARGLEGYELIRAEEALETLGDGGTLGLGDDHAPRDAGIDAD